MWLLSFVVDAFDQLQQVVYEGLVQPLMYALGMANLLEDGFTATGWLLVGVIEIVLMLTVMRALERWRPVEPVTDRSAIREDVLYTLIHRLGLFRLALFFTVDPLWDGVMGELHLLGLPSFHLEQLWPGVSDIAIVSFLLYLVLFDFVDYWVHRGQHQLHWWWQLHALHHSQRQMTLWSDNRNHLLDDLLRDSAMVVVALAVGIAPGQFIAVVAFTQLLESLSHANVRMSFGWLGRLVVSPRFHRLHHSIGLGHESRGRGSIGGHNFAVLLPVWDVLFGTANFEDRYDPTGIRDQLPEEGGRDYGRGFLAQQWLGLRRLARRAEPPSA
jgi:sterol desaturase/sphingolipid hydroxylase (fatty acid hydroxylase superfamily)